MDMKPSMLIWFCPHCSFIFIRSSSASSLWSTSAFPCYLLRPIMLLCSFFYFFLSLKVCFCVYVIWFICFCYWNCISVLHLCVFCAFVIEPLFKQFWLFGFLKFTPLFCCSYIPLFFVRLMLLLLSAFSLVVASISLVYFCSVLVLIVYRLYWQKLIVPDVIDICLFIATLLYTLFIPCFAPACLHKLPHCFHLSVGFVGFHVLPEITVNGDA